MCSMMSVSNIQMSVEMENIKNTILVLHSHSLPIYFGMDFNTAQYAIKYA